MRARAAAAAAAYLGAGAAEPAAAAAAACNTIGFCPGVPPGDCTVAAPGRGDLAESALFASTASLPAVGGVGAAAGGASSWAARLSIRRDHALNSMACAGEPCRGGGGGSGRCR